MDNRKFEQLIDMIINENEEQARELFHEIVVEKSREIYESMMDEEDGMMETSGDMVGDLMDEIESDDQMAMEDADMEDEEELDDVSMDMDDMEMDDEEDEMRDEADLEDRVVDLEDKLDELMAEFEEIMGRDEEEEMGDEEEMMEMGYGENDIEEDQAMMEAIQLKKVSVTHGDNGVQTKSVVSNGPKVPGNGAAPVNFSGGADSKGRPNPSVKDVDGSSSWQNKAGKDMAKPGKAPAPVKSQASGTNTKDVVPGN
jgi:hypothetical protein